MIWIVFDAEIIVAHVYVIPSWDYKLFEFKIARIPDHFHHHSFVRLIFNLGVPWPQASHWINASLYKSEREREKEREKKKSRGVALIIYVCMTLDGSTKAKQLNNLNKNIITRDTLTT